VSSSYFTLYYKLIFRSLDLSFNNIRHPPNLPSLTKVKVMYLVQNKIAKVQAGELDWCSNTITSIELGGNRIRVRSNLFLMRTWLMIGD
jgi:protein phosphatase 1 regulatory subunit 7